MTERSEASGESRKSLFDLTPNQAREWLAEGNTFVLPAGQGRYVMRCAADGSYLVYHHENSTFGQLQQLSAPYGSYYTQNELGVTGESLWDVSPREQKERLDNGEVFTAPISNGENFKLARMDDGAYVQYIPQRQTFETAWQRAAQYGPMNLWEQSDEYGDLPSLPKNRTRRT